MNHHPPTPPEIDETPVLAILSVLDFALEASARALTAVHPEIAGPDDLPLMASAARCAERMVRQAYKLKLLLASYSHFVTDGDEDSGGEKTGW